MLFVRIDNVFDERYENPTGFQRPGLGVFGGASFTWGPTSPQRSEANDKTQLTRAEKETAK